MLTPIVCFSTGKARSAEATNIIEIHEHLTATIEKKERKLEAAKPAYDKRLNSLKINLARRGKNK